MGTRADFYVGIGKNAEWLGSVGWDGYEWDNADNALINAATESEYRAAVADIARSREDWTAPEQGWPWPWKDSNTTDYAYAHHNGRTEVFTKQSEWPDMSARENVAYGNRSGLIIISR